MAGKAEHYEIPGQDLHGEIFPFIENVMRELLYQFRVPYNHPGHAQSTAVMRIPLAHSNGKLEFSVDQPYKGFRLYSGADLGRVFEIHADLIKEQIKKGHLILPEEQEKHQKPFGQGRTTFSNVLLFASGNGHGNLRVVLANDESVEKLRQHPYK